MRTTNAFVRDWMMKHPVKATPPPKPSRKTKATLQAEFDVQRRELRGQIDESKRQIELEQLQRVAAQRGLVPYVRSLEAFHTWLLTQPLLARKVEAKMRALGIWDIHLGYDPANDIHTSLASAERVDRVRT